MANPFVHVELSTTDPAKATGFYGKLFGWKLQDMPMPDGTYTMVDVGENGTGGGIMKQMMPGGPSAWMPYVAVDDLKKSTATAKELGATIVKDGVEIPDMGSFSIIIDPTGAMLGLWQNKA
jgi:predicted enzyme related to lactoylglutathione lyase